MQGSKDEKLKKLQENNRLIVQQKSTPRQSFRADGYVNVLNKYGTAKDNSEAYGYVAEPQIMDTVLINHYETNGLFTKIIDIPAQEAVKKGFKLNIGNDDVEKYIIDKITDLGWDDIAEESLRWSRLFGGALGVMLIDDGCDDLTKPVNWQLAKKIEEIVVYDRSCVTPDYASLYSNYGQYGIKRKSKTKMPEFYDVFSIYGSFRVHESRCLVFRNGKLPEKASTQDFRFWGIPEYNKLKRALRETVTAHSDSVKLLERMVQAIYKMKNLSQILATDSGEDDVLKRLGVIDAARGILSSIVIDSDGEDYDFKTFTLSGIKEVIDSTCNMLSSITEIPQTKLFGRSPAGMDATGDSDLENYYSFVDKIRKTQLRDNLSFLVDAVIQIGINNHELTGNPKYKLEFEPLQNENEEQKAQTEQTKATTEQTKATTAQAYLDMGVLSPQEVRKDLHERGLYGIEDDELPETEDDEAFKELLTSIGGGTQTKVPIAKPEPVLDSRVDQSQTIYDGASGVGVIVIKKGKILVGNRHDRMGICSPGGHIEEWEDAERAAYRETEEEFGIQLKELIPIGFVDGLEEYWGRPFLFLATEYDGEVLPDTTEMHENRFEKLSSILEASDLAVYPPFKKGLEMFLTQLSPFLEEGKNEE